MTRPRTFTSAVYRWLAGDPSMGALIRQHRGLYADQDRCEIALAEALCEVFEDRWLLFTGQSDDTSLLNELMRLAKERVCFRLLARALLKSFTLPAMLAAPRGRLPSPAYTASFN